MPSSLFRSFLSCWCERKSLRTKKRMNLVGHSYGYEIAKVLKIINSDPRNLSRSVRMGLGSVRTSLIPTGHNHAKSVQMCRNCIWMLKLSRFLTRNTKKVYSNVQYLHSNTETLWNFNETMPWSVQTSMKSVQTLRLSGSWLAPRVRTVQMCVRMSTYHLLFLGFSGFWFSSKHYVDFTSEKEFCSPF